MSTRRKKNNRKPAVKIIKRRVKLSYTQATKNYTTLRNMERVQDEEREVFDKKSA